MKRSWQEHITRPEIALPLVYFFFLALAYVALRLEATRRYIIAPAGAFREPGLESYAITVLGIILLGASALAGSRLDRRIKPLWIAPLIAILGFTAITRGTTFTAPVAIAISLGYPLLLFFVSRRMSDIDSLGIMAYGLALAFSASILVRGVPILTSAGRASTAIDPSRALFHGFAVFSGTLLTAGQKRGWAATGVLSLAVVGILSGFKSDAVSVILAAVLAGLLMGRISAKEMAAAFAFVLIILTGISTLIAFVSYEQWKISPLLYIVYRAGFTFAAFGMVTEASYPLGYLKGSALLDPTQRILSSTLLSKYYPEPHIITSTMIGPGMLDFGLLGVAATTVAIGLYLGYMYRQKRDSLGNCLYAIALTHSIILVEVGLQLTSILFFLSLLYLTLWRVEK